MGDLRAETVLRLRDVFVLRGGAAILRGVDWSVDSDQRWVVLGPNGAGKTTLLQIAATLLAPSRGSVEVLGEQLGAADVFELRPRIGVASAALAERLPAGERVLDLVMTAAYAVIGRWREVYEPADEMRALALLDAVGCGALAERRFGTLSEGERKRAQLARALMTDPELLLLDEPAAGLDLGGREDLLRRLTALAADRAAPATVLVTHHVEEIPAGFTHALLLRGGSVVAAGTAPAVLTAPALSECFGLPLDVEHGDGRYTARAAAVR